MYTVACIPPDPSPTIRFTVYRNTPKSVGILLETNERGTTTSTVFLTQENKSYPTDPRGPYTDLAPTRISILVSSFRLENNSNVHSHYYFLNILQYSTYVLLTLPLGSLIRKDKLSLSSDFLVSCESSFDPGVVADPSCILILFTLSPYESK